MAWTDLTFTGCSVLTAGQMTQLQANFAALAAADSGSPTVTRVWMHPGSASHGVIVPKLLDAQGSIGAGQPEGWHEAGAAGEPGFQNSWTNFGSGFETLAFLKDANGLVHLKGTIKGGTLTAAAFTLPAGYRPAAIIEPVAASNGGYGQVRINAAGSVIPQIGSNVAISLDGVHFKAAA